MGPGSGDALGCTLSFEGPSATSSDADEEEETTVASFSVFANLPEGTEITRLNADLQPVFVEVFVEDWQTESFVLEGSTDLFRIESSDSLVTARELGESDVGDHSLTLSAVPPSGSGCGSISFQVGVQVMANDPPSCLGPENANSDPIEVHHYQAIVPSLLDALQCDSGGAGGPYQLHIELHSPAIESTPATTVTIDALGQDVFADFVGLGPSETPWEVTPCNANGHCTEEHYELFVNVLRHQERLLPYGYAYGDQALENADDKSASVIVSEGIPLWGTYHFSVHVSVHKVA